MIAALFGLVIFLDLKICSITLTGFCLLSLYCSILGQYNDDIFLDADVFRV